MRLVCFGWVSKFQEGCLYLFLFVSSLLEAEGLPKKDMRELFFPIVSSLIKSYAQLLFTLLALR